MASFGSVRGCAHAQEPVFAHVSARSGTPRSPLGVKGPPVRIRPARLVKVQVRGGFEETRGRLWCWDWPHFGLIYGGGRRRTVRYTGKRRQP